MHATAADTISVELESGAKMVFRGFQECEDWNTCQHTSHIAGPVFQLDLDASSHKEVESLIMETYLTLTLGAPRWHRLLHRQPQDRDWVRENIAFLILPTNAFDDIPALTKGKWLKVGAVTKTNLAKGDQSRYACPPLTVTSSQEYASDAVVPDVGWYSTDTETGKCYVQKMDIVNVTSE